MGELAENTQRRKTRDEILISCDLKLRGQIPFEMGKLASILLAAG